MKQHLYYFPEKTARIENGKWIIDIFVRQNNVLTVKCATLYSDLNVHTSNTSLRILADEICDNLNKIQK